MYWTTFAGSLALSSIPQIAGQNNYSNGSGAQERISVAPTIAGSVGAVVVIVLTFVLLWYLRRKFPVNMRHLPKSTMEPNASPC